ncbi:hypothetical protein LUZ60_012863 [Juncus effusus]|nr:hypothetical protein LUZ60_012863 [Juncus effusus]
MIRLRRALPLKSALRRSINHHPPPIPDPLLPSPSSLFFISTNIQNDTRSLQFPFTHFPRFFSDQPSSPEDGGSDQNPDSASNPSPLTQDITNTELKQRLEKYYEVDEETDAQSIAEAVLLRKLSGKHEETDDELLEELRNKPLPEVKDRDFESDFEEMYETDEEIDNLYNARQYVEKKMISDEFFNMDDKKWDDMIREATEKGFLKDTKECEDILEDMLNYDNLLPDEIKKKVEAKYNELESQVDKGELEPEKAYEIFQQFEDQTVQECLQIMDSQNTLELQDENSKEDKGEIGIKDKKQSVELDDPPGEGPILRWESRVVFAPGGDAWHPKNRKVKLSVTVRELGLSQHGMKRLREVVGKRYHSGKDELTITSERYEHREENRKDCLRTLYALIEDAVKADKLVEVARNAYVKDRLKNNAKFMERLKVKASQLKQAQAA